MASGKTHDLATHAATPLVFLLADQTAHTGWYASMVLALGFWIGGIFLSPDLDTRSRPFYRWGWFRFIWWPYQWVAPHRSSASHGVIFAPFFRLLYLTAVLVLLYTGLAWFLESGRWSVEQFWRARPETRLFLQQHLNDLLLLGVGIWGGSLLHVGLDTFSSALPFKKWRR